MNNKINALKCPQCNAPLDSLNGIIHCKYCGGNFYFDGELSSIKIEEYEYRCDETCTCGCYFFDGDCPTHGKNNDYGRDAGLPRPIVESPSLYNEWCK